MRQHLVRDVVGSTAESIQEAIKLLEIDGWEIVAANELGRKHHVVNGIKSAASITRIYLSRPVISESQPS